MQDTFLEEVNSATDVAKLRWWVFSLSPLYLQGVFARRKQSDKGLLLAQLAGVRVIFLQATPRVFIVEHREFACLNQNQVPDGPPSIPNDTCISGFINEGRTNVEVLRENNS